MPDAPEAGWFAGCVEATRRFAECAGFREAVIGLSGGIDSALVAVMAREAFGAERVHGVVMPGPFSSAESAEDAYALAERLGIAVVTLGISEATEAFCRELSAGGCAPSGLTVQNIQARCRMVYLMAFSNEYGWMVLNTSNRSEVYTGYSTMYGDMAGAFAPIGGLYKTQVRAVCAWLNAQAREAGGTQPVPERIITKPPSAELASGQTDEASLGISYELLDEILSAHLEGGCGRKELVAAGFAPEKVDRVLHLVAASAWKRAYEPPCPQLARGGGCN